MFTAITIENNRSKKTLERLMNMMETMNKVKNLLSSRLKMKMMQ